MAMDGTLDFTLTKPEEAQLLVSIQEVDIWEVLNIVLGLGVLSVALTRLGETVGPPISINQPAIRIAIIPSVYDTISLGDALPALPSGRTTTRHPRSAAAVIRVGEKTNG
jgi:ABC-type uncharacterized transport system permease subunit